MGQKVQKTLPVKLTDAECKAKATSFSSLMTNYVRVEDEKKAAAKQFKERLEEIWTDMLKVKRAVDAGSEDRVVECEERHDLKRWALSLWRLDTDPPEQVGPERNMTPEEQEKLRQQDLFNLEKAPDYSNVPEQPPAPPLMLPAHAAATEPEALGFYDGDDDGAGDGR